MIEYEITSEAKQSFIIPFEDNEIEVELEFLSTKGFWIISIRYQGKELINGLRLNSSIPLLDTFNLPFDFYIKDVNNLGLDPFDIDNFSDGFYTFNLLTRDELAELRGFEVE